MKDEDTRPTVTPFNKDIQPPTDGKPLHKDVTDSPTESMISSSNNNPVITVVRDPQHHLGKEFTLNPDGTLSKKSSVSVSLGIAIMHLVNTHEDLAALLKVVGEDPHASIINASFIGVDIGEEFVIASEREIENRTNIPRSDRERQKGIHRIVYDEKPYKAIGRFKENVRPSCWQFFDRDIDKHTPEEFKNMSFEEWLSTLGKMLQGIGNVSYCRVGSTSTRVFHDGKPVGSGNGHVWIKVENPEDVDRFRTVMLINAVHTGLTWNKPRYSRKEENKVVGYSLTTIIDTSVWTTGRLVFIGKPVVSEGLTVESLPIALHKGETDSLNTKLLSLPDAQTIQEITRKVGIPMEVSDGSTGLRITASDLTFNTEIETEDLGVLTMREIVERGISAKIRCQTPFRESSSFAAFISTGKDGKPFVFDVGTGVTHWLTDSCIKDFEFIRATGVAKGILLKVKEDCGAPLEPEAVKALAVIREQNPAYFQRIRAELKKVNKEVSLGALDTAIKEQAGENAVPETHHGYACDVIQKLTVGEYPPVGHAGSLYVVNPAEGIWIPCPMETVIRKVTMEHDGKENCKRSSDYNGIAQLVVMLATHNDLFANAPEGLACPGGFYQIIDNEIKVEPLSPSHLQRVKIDVTPEPQETPMFDRFLHETFESTIPDDEEQQLMLLQEIAGAVMFGIMAKHQKGVLFYEPYGRAGKGTMERLLRELVPPTFVTAVSPFNWNSEYYIASLAGARLNVVGELPSSKSIPAAPFKTVTGGDLLSGRHPNHRPISFKNEAAHLFMSNHLINTIDHSEAFFSRWLLVDFPNSRLKSGLPIDPDLAERIIKQELPGIAHWAMIGAQRLMANGSFSISSAHKRLMDKWRRNSNSLEEFIYECCELTNGTYVRRSTFYQEYKTWCAENGRHNFAKGTVKELLEHNIGLGISWASLDGHEIFRGVSIKSSNPNLPDITL